MGCNPRPELHILGPRDNDTARPRPRVSRRIRYPAPTGGLHGGGCCEHEHGVISLVHEAGRAMACHRPSGLHLDAARSTVRSRDVQRPRRQNSGGHPEWGSRQGREVARRFAQEGARIVRGSVNAEGSRTVRQVQQHDGEMLSWDPTQLARRRRVLTSHHDGRRQIRDRHLSQSAVAVMRLRSARMTSKVRGLWTWTPSATGGTAGRRASAARAKRTLEVRPRQAAPTILGLGWR